MQLRKQPARFVTEIVVSRALPCLLAPGLWLMAWTQLLFNGWYLSVASYKKVGLEKPHVYPGEPTRAFSQRNRTKALF